MIQQEYYEIELPGKKNYNSDVKIEIKKITPFDQKKFYSNMSNANNDEKIIVLKDFIKGLTKCTNIEFEDIYYPDYIYIMYQIREATYKLFPIKFTYICPDCGEKQLLELKLDSLEINSLDNPLKKTINLENYGEVSIRYKKTKDDIIIGDFLTKIGENKNDLSMATLAAELLFLDEWKPINELWEMAKSGEITSQDIANIEQFISENYWGVVEILKSKCNKCGKEVAENYSIDPTSFFSANNN